MTTESILFAFGLTLFAGLSTGIGSALAFFSTSTNRILLSISLGFSAGVMIYISFVEMFPQAQSMLKGIFGITDGGFFATLAFFGGILFTAIIDYLVPAYENPHEFQEVEEIDNKKHAEEYRKLHRLGLFSALVIAIHNFPEGLATFMGALQNPSLGISLAVAIAIHNIPEGIAVSIPIFYATGSKKRAFFLSFASGLAEPLGALLGFLIFFSFYSETLAGLIFAAVAGIMVYIALDELLPAAREYGKPHHVLFGLVTGMAVMAGSLLLLIP